MKTLSGYLLTAVAIGAALLLISASCAMNYAFWSGRGTTAVNGYIFGSVSVAIDILKAILPLFVVFAIGAVHVGVIRRFAYVSIGGGLFVVFVAASLVSAIGFISTNKGQIAGGKDALNARLFLAKKELSELDSRSSRLTGYPPSSAIEAGIQAMQQNRRWTASAKCTDATASKSRSFCKGYFEAQAQLAGAVESGRVDVQRADLRRELRRLQMAGAGQETDPQASLLARFLPGFDVSDTATGLTLFFAVLVELGAAFGLYLATQHGGMMRPGVALQAATQPGNKGYPASPGLSGSPALPAPRADASMEPVKDAKIIDLKAEKPERFVFEDARDFLEGRV